MSDGMSTVRDPDVRCNSPWNGRGDYPVNCIDLERAACCCYAQGKRLPTEEEWEWAARGGVRGVIYPWGDAPPASQVCWSAVQKRDRSCAVGTFPEGGTPGGIYDLAGNVAEWTQGDLDAGRSLQVIRGGSWYSDNAASVRAVDRDYANPKGRFVTVGFRCVR